MKEFIFCENFWVLSLTLLILQQTLSFRDIPGNLKVFRSSKWQRTRVGGLSTIATEIIDKYTAIPGVPADKHMMDNVDAESTQQQIIREIRPSITDKARTITHVCSSATLCTTSTMNDVPGYPFGSYVDYILDEKGWPVLLLSEQSLHTQNIRINPAVSLFCQLPRSHNSQSAAALSRVTLMGTISQIPKDEHLDTLKLAFSIRHPYAEQILDSARFNLYHIKPEKIYFSGGFGVMACWVNVEEYERARPDVLAHEVPSVMSRTNTEKQGELLLICKHFLGLRPSEVEVVRIQAIDRLGIDLRVKCGDFTDEYRVGFRHSANSSEDVKSEMIKLFHEAWEREQGYHRQQQTTTGQENNRDAYGNGEEQEEDHSHDVGDGVPVTATAAAYAAYGEDDLPPFEKFAEDILRNEKPTR